MSGDIRTVLAVSVDDIVLGVPLDCICGALCAGCPKARTREFVGIYDLPATLVPVTVLRQQAYPSLSISSP